MRRVVLLVVSLGALAGVGCARNVEWAGSCTAQCANGTTVTDSEIVCASDSRDPDTVARDAASRCVDAINSRNSNCDNPVCTCSVVESDIEC